MENKLIQRGQTWELNATLFPISIPSMNCSRKIVMVQKYVERTKGRHVFEYIHKDLSLIGSVLSIWVLTYLLDHIFWENWLLLIFPFQPRTFLMSSHEKITYLLFYPSFVQEIIAKIFYSAVLIFLGLLKGYHSSGSRENLRGSGITDKIVQSISSGITIWKNAEERDFLGAITNLSFPIAKDSRHYSLRYCCGGLSFLLGMSSAVRIQEDKHGFDGIILWWSALCTKESAIFREGSRIQRQQLPRFVISNGVFWHWNREQIIL